jgi:hypothetical protein
MVNVRGAGVVGTGVNVGTLPGTGGGVGVSSEEPNGNRQALRTIRIVNAIREKRFDNERFIMAILNAE